MHFYLEDFPAFTILTTIYRAIIIFCLSIFATLALSTELIDVAAAYLDTEVNPISALAIVTHLLFWVPVTYILWDAYIFINRGEYPFGNKVLGVLIFIGCILFMLSIIGNVIFWALFDFPITFPEKDILNFTYSTIIFNSLLIAGYDIFQQKQKKDTLKYVEDVQLLQEKPKQKFFTKRQDDWKVW